MTAASSGVRWIGCGALLWFSTACTAHSGQVRSNELAAERLRSAHAEQQVTALEARLARLEQQLGPRARPTTDKQASDKLDGLIAAQERLVRNLERLQTPVVPPAPPAAGPRDPRALRSQPASASNPALSAYIEELLERAQSDAPPWRGGLSREKREALRVLLKPERSLDLGNPMEL